MWFHSKYYFHIFKQIKTKTRKPKRKINENARKQTPHSVIRHVIRGNVEPDNNCIICDMNTK